MRARAIPAGVLLAAAVGLKFLPFNLLLFYLAAGRWRPVAAGAGIGILALIASAVALPDRTAEYPRFAPRLLELDWVYAHIARPGPSALAALFWSDAFPFPLALTAASVLVAVLAGIAARRDPPHEDTWHGLTLATAGYLAPFGYFWTTFLILSLPLAADTLRRAAARAPRERAVIVGAVVLSWLLMEPQEVGTLVPILWHFLGVVLLCATAVLTLLRPSAVPFTLSGDRARTSPLGWRSVRRASCSSLSSPARSSSSPAERRLRSATRSSRISAASTRPAASSA